MNDIRNHSINNLIDKIIKYTLYLIVTLILILITLGIVNWMANVFSGNTNSTSSARYYNANSVPTIYVGPNSKKVIEIGPKYRNWIMVDTRCDWNFITDNPSRVAIKFQFRNRTETHWIPNKTSTYFGNKIWTKTFRVKTRKGFAHMTITTGKRKY